MTSDTKRRVRNNRLITWPAAGFLLGLGAPIRDATVSSVTDVLLASSLIALLPAVIGLVAALLRMRRPTNEIRSVALLVGLSIATIVLKLANPNGLALIPAAVFLWQVRVKD